MLVISWRCMELSKIIIRMMLWLNLRILHCRIILRCLKGFKRIRCILLSLLLISSRICFRCRRRWIIIRIRRRRLRSFWGRLILNCQLVCISPLLKVPLPIYIDFNQYYNILNIVVDETRLFATKMRTPFYICL